MAINTPQNSNTQLNGILSSTPSIPSMPKPPGILVTGGFSLNEFITPPSPYGLPAATGTGAIVVGGGTTPANGAQPPAPTGTLPTAPATPAAPTGANATPTAIVPTTTNPVAATAATTTTTTTTTTSMTPGGGATFETYGFGKAERNMPITVDSGGASFVMPSFNDSAKANTAPPVSWGPGWTKVEKDGMWYMEHSNGLKAIPAVEYRVTPNPAEKVSTVKVANGWGKKFPDGTIVVFDRKEGPYKLDPQGNKHKLELGTHTIAGVKVRVFEATVVRTLDKDGNVNVFDSRGNKSAGSKRGRLAAALGAANAGATISGGGKGGGPSTDSGPSTASGPGGKGTLVGGGTAVTTEQMTKNVQKLTELARTLTAEIRSGSVDPARLADLQAQLNALPSGILQAAGAAGTMTTDGRDLRHAGETHAATTPAATTPAATTGAASPSSANGTPPAPPVPGSSSPATGQVVGNAAATGGGATAPVAGVDANATTKQLAAGAKAKLEVAPPAELHGKQARFAQLPDAVQAAVAKAFGSDQGAAALKADQLVAFTADGNVTLVEGGTVFTKHQAQVRGAGPGEEIAMTVRPGRQPGSVGAMNVNIGRPSVTGGGAAAASTTKKPAKPAVTTRPIVPSVPTVAPVNATAAAKAGRISLFPLGSETRDVAFGGLNGSYTWKNLPAKAKQAILAQLADGSTAAGKAYASRTGSGWSIDPRSIIVLDAGYASFASGLALVRTAPKPAATIPLATPPVAGGGPSAGTLGHDATKPPTGGGGVNPVAPNTPPPMSAHSGH